MIEVICHAETHQMSSPEAPFGFPPLPQQIDVGTKGGLVAIEALEYLLNKIASGGQIADGDLFLVKLMNHYFHAWRDAIPETPSPQLHGAILLLNNLGDKNDLTDGDLAIADALLTVARHWGRYLKSLPEPAAEH